MKEYAERSLNANDQSVCGGLPAVLVEEEEEEEREEEEEEEENHRKIRLADNKRPIINLHHYTILLLFSLQVRQQNSQVRIEKEKKNVLIYFLIIFTS